MFSYESSEIEINTLDCAGTDTSEMHFYEMETLKGETQKVVRNLDDVT